MNIDSIETIDDLLEKLESDGYLVAFIDYDSVSKVLIYGAYKISLIDGVWVNQIFEGERLLHTEPLKNEKEAVILFQKITNDFGDLKGKSISFSFSKEKHNKFLEALKQADKIDLQYLGSVPLVDDDLDHDSEAFVNGREVDVSLFCPSQVDLANEAKDLKLLLEKIALIDKENAQLLLENFDDPKADCVKTYLSYSTDYLSDEEIVALTDCQAYLKSKSLRDLVPGLHLIAFRINLESDDGRLVMDYSIGEDHTNHMVVLYFDKDGKYTGDTIES